MTIPGASAVIAFADASISTTHLKLGPGVQEMTEHEILERFNDCIRAQEELAKEYEHIAIEIPPGKPQIERSAHSQQWVPRGGVLRCLISDEGPDNEPIIQIDDKELSWMDFGLLLTTYAGWGMRVGLVPDDELHEVPVVEVREPDRR